jgi:hypothetical protein
VTERGSRSGEPFATFQGGAEIKIWIGSGRYRCEGTLTREGLTAKYDADYDAGQFRLAKVPGSTAD